MNQTLTILNQRTSIREFKLGLDILNADINTIVSSAKKAPSWENGQTYSIVIFEGTEKNKLVRLLSKNNNIQNAKIINSASLFLIFNIDLSRFNINSSLENEIEPILISSTDAALSLENAVIAAESLGFGSCVIGGIRRDANIICKEFNYPEKMFPLAGLAIGYPEITKKIKPKLPNSVNVFHAKDTNKLANREDLEAYNIELQEFAKQSGYETAFWHTKISAYFDKKQFPPNTRKYLRDKNFF